MAQPSFHCVANLGDANPFEYGGRFLMVDRRGSYNPELWIFVESTDDDPKMMRYAVTLEHCFQYDNDGIIQLGTNIYHPHIAEWFGTNASIKAMADYVGMKPEELRLKFCGNTHDRACAYGVAIDYYGVDEFDHYPLAFENARKAKAFCNRMLRQIEKARALPDGCGRR
jgi:hypothetical protein